jgi:hypothetical protein
MDVLRKQLVLVEAVVAKAAPKDKAVLSQKLGLLRAKIRQMEEQHEARLGEVRSRNDRAHSELQQLSDKFAAQHEGYGRVSDVAEESQDSLHETSTDSESTLHDRDSKYDFRRASEASTVEPSEASDEDVAEFAILRRSCSAPLLSVPEPVEPSPLPLDTPSPEWPQARVPCGAFMGMAPPMGMSQPWLVVGQCTSVQPLFGAYSY